MPKKQISIPTINCKDCVKRPTCTQLCPAVERYVSQDNVPYGSDTHALSMVYRNGESPWAESPECSKLPMTEREIIVSTLVSAGIPRDLIRKYLKMAPYRLRKIIQRIREKNQPI